MRSSPNLSPGGETQAFPSLRNPVFRLVERLRRQLIVHLRGYQSHGRLPGYQRSCINVDTDVKIYLDGEQRHAIPMVTNGRPSPWIPTSGRLREYQRQTISMDTKGRPSPLIPTSGHRHGCQRQAISLDTKGRPSPWIPALKKLPAFAKIDQQLMHRKLQTVRGPIPSLLVSHAPSMAGPSSACAA